LWFSDVDLNAQNQVTLWTPLHAAAFQEHGPVSVNGLWSLEGNAV